MLTTGFGELDRAIECLERGFEERPGAMFGVKGSFLIAPLRGHPGFTAILERINIA